MNASCNLKYYPAISDLVIDLNINKEKGLTKMRLRGSVYKQLYQSQNIRSRTGIKAVLEIITAKICNEKKNDESSSYQEIQPIYVMLHRFLSEARINPF